MDPIVEALRVAFLGGMDGAQANEYLESVKQSADGWKLCASRLLLPCEDQALFFYLLVLQHTIDRRWTELNAQEKMQMKNTIMTFLEHGCNKENVVSYVRNRMATLLLRLTLQDNSEQWPQMFRDLMKLSSQGPVMFDMFLRFLNAVNSEVCSLEFDRTPTETARCAAFKDMMREFILPELINSLYLFLNTYTQSLPKLAEKVLFTLSPYIVWIDINLIQNERFIPYLFNALSHQGLQLAACSCLLKVVSKRMVDPVKKLAQFQQLDILQVISSLTNLILHPNAVNERVDDKDIFADVVAEMVCSVGCSLVNMIENLSSFNEEQKSFHASSLELVSQLNFQIFSQSDYLLAREVLDFIVAYSNILQKNEAMKQIAPTVMTTILGLCAIQIQFRPDYKFEDDKKDDYEVDFDDFRTIVGNIIKNASKLSTSLVIQFIYDHLNRLFPQLSTASFSLVESSLWMFNILAEGVPNYQSLISANPAFSDIMKNLISSQICSYPNALILQLLMDLIARYCKFFENCPEYIPPAVSIFINNSGIQNSNPTIRNRACFFLYRLIRHFTPTSKSMLGSIADEIVSCLQNTIFKVLERDWNAEPIVLVDSMQSLVEVVGILISPVVLGDRARDVLAAVLQQYQNALQASIEKVCQYKNEVPAKRMAEVMTAIANIVKSWSGDARLVHATFINIQNFILQAFNTFPTSPEVRSATLFFLHRAVEALPSSVMIPIVTDVSSRLLEGSRADNISAFMDLINQIIVKFRIESFPLVQAIFLECTSRLFSSFKEYSFLDTAAALEMPEAVLYADKRSLLNLKKCLYSFLNYLLTNNCGTILFSDNVIPAIPMLLSPVVADILHPELAVSKICFLVSTQVVKIFDAKLLQFPQISQFFIEHFIPSIIMAPFVNGFSLDILSCSIFLSEICDILIHFVKLFGRPIVEEIGKLLVSNVRLPMNLAQQYCEVVSLGDPKQLLEFYKTVLLRKK